ncbi:MAG: hypothetical protein U1E27_05870, partial [Kiritimatiellia bacterium]|nr:hypothetical protein [Kiritimatiellia bacterium]
TAPMVDPGPRQTVEPSEPVIHRNPVEVSRAAYLEYLDVMQEVVSLSRRRSWGAAQNLLRQWMTDHPGHPHEPDLLEQVERLEAPQQVWRTVAARSEQIRGLSIEGPTGFSGEVVSINSSLIRIQRKLGEGVAQTDMDIAQLRPGDRISILRRADPSLCWVNEGVLALAQGDGAGAEAALTRAEAEGMDAVWVRDWQADWQRLTQNFQARAILAEVRNLIIHSQFPQAAERMNRIRNVFSDTDIVRWIQRSDVEEWSDLLAREGALVSSNPAMADDAADPDDDPSEDSTVIDLVTAGELSARMAAYHGRVIRLRFRARSEIESRGYRSYQADLIGEDGKIQATFREDGVRWVRGIPLLSTRNRDQFVFGRVNAETGDLELLGRTRRMLTGVRGREFAW